MRTHEEVRRLWQPACGRELTTFVFHGGARATVAVETTDAWRALDQVMQRHQYPVRRGETGGYDCRDIRAGGPKSLHAFGIACDINWNTNHLRRDNVLVTDMPRRMIDDIIAIRTVGGARIFWWGGDYETFKDAHHFEIMASPAELVAGIDWSTVRAPRPRSDLPRTWPTLQRGDRGPTVAKLQAMLADVGFDPLPPNGAGEGTFGPRTDAQVRAYQRSRRLVVDGVVGSQTWTALLNDLPDVDEPDRPGSAGPGDDSMIEPGMTGVAVEELQALLIELGRAKGVPPGIPDTPGNRDGVYGPATQRVVRDFQRANGLLADGRVGPVTWAALVVAARG